MHQNTEGFRVSSKIQRQLANRKRRIENRLNRTNMGENCPVLSASNIHYEIAERTRAISSGGIGLIHQMVKRLDLDSAINNDVNLLKIHLPYSESDHVLNMAYNLLAGGPAVPVWNTWSCSETTRPISTRLVPNVSPTRPRPVIFADGSMGSRFST